MDGLFAMSFDSLLGISVLFMFIAALVYVVFGQVTVRKLRKNPATRDNLGLEFASGWDILNVAGALSRPKWLSERVRKSTLACTAADERPLYAHTNKFDRFLARLLTTLSLGSVAAFFGLSLLNAIGWLD
jgi:hypothetical protein